MSKLLLCVLLCVPLVAEVSVGEPVADDDAAGRLYPVDCVVPSCLTELDRATVWPFEDPNFFLRCEPTGTPWELVRHPCSGRRLFHFARQRCTAPLDWEVPCGGTINPGPLEPCPEVSCATEADLGRLWPTEEPPTFLQCIPQASGGIAPVLQHCPYGTLFSLRHQACISVFRWEAECSFGGELTPGPTGGEPTTTEMITTTTQIVTQPPPTSTTVPGWTLCQRPLCEREDPVLYPHASPSYFWQCVPQPNGFWEAQMRPCAAGTFFHYGLQQCVFPADWFSITSDLWRRSVTDRFSVRGVTATISTRDTTRWSGLVGLGPRTTSISSSTSS
uniref:Chitin-binding type-2 domain-containing protein n=1 Tax=Anopheles merus TaxID=30066 RepID=A0A182USG5_ANOME